MIYNILVSLAFDRSTAVRNLLQVAVAPVGTKAWLVHRETRKGPDGKKHADKNIHDS